MLQHRSLRALVSFLCILRSVSSDEREVKSLFTLKSGCALLGYPEASLNKCGFCVGPETSLPSDFGVDCLGRCNLHATSGYDCAGQCYGSSFRDQCSNSCVNSSESVHSADSGRDCRGLCTSELSPDILLFQYKRDKCNVCRLASEASADSPSTDCSGQCVPPSGPRSTFVCNKCFNQTSLDTCSVCPDATCSCDKNASVCGCSDLSSCYSVMSIAPKFLPKKLVRTVTLTGYFAPVSKDLQCVFKHESTSTVIVTQINMNDNNRTSVTCTISLPKVGLWTLGLRTSRSVKNLHIDEDIVLYVFDKETISFTSLTPSKLLISQTKDLITFKVKPSSPQATPNLPLVCRICSMKEASTWEIISQSGPTVHSCSVKPDKLLQTSQELTVSFTFDGYEVLAPVFRVKVIAGVPNANLRTSFISSDGLSIVVSFDCPIDITDFTTPSSISLCRQVLSLTSSPLHLAKCAWASKNQFVIHLKKPILESSVDVKFNPGVLKQFGQEIRMVNEDEVTVTLAKLTSEWFLYTPRLLITGPDEVPSCGIFTLSPYLSAPQGTWGATYEWSVVKNDQVSMDAYTKVNQYVSLVTLGENLIVPSELLTYEYQFTFQLTVKLIDGTSVTATHSVTRYPVESPLVSIYSTSMLPVSPVTLDQTVTLIAHLTLPHCVSIVQQIYLTWFVNDVRVRFNFTHPYFPIYQVTPYALASVPSAVNTTQRQVTFGVASFFGHRQVNSTKAYFTVKSLDAHYTAIINDGAIMITTGTVTGSLQLSGSSSTGANERLLYQWSCSDAEQTPCLDHAPPDQWQTSKQSIGYLLIDSTIQGREKLTLEVNSLPPNRDLFFALKVYQANYPVNATRGVSETELLQVKTVPGNPPQIIIGPILINHNIRATIRSPHNLAFLVPEHTDVTIKGKVVHSVSNLKSLVWTSDNLLSTPSFTHHSDAPHSTLTSLVVPREFVYSYALHTIKLRACSLTDECAEVSTQISVTPGITGCFILVDPYTELTFPLKLEIISCNIPPGLSPVTFQIFASDSIEIRPLSVPTFDRIFFIPGPPGVTSTSITFIVRVCDILSNCQTYESHSIDIEENVNVTASAYEVLSQVNKFSQAGGYTEAVSFLIPLLLVNNNDKSLQYSRVISRTVDLVLEYTVNSLDQVTFILTSGHTAVYLRAINEAIRSTDDTGILSKLFAAIRKIALRARGMKVKLDVNQVDSLVQTIVNRFNLLTDRSKIDDNIAEEAQLAIASLFSAIARSLVLGERLQLGQFVQLGPLTSKGDLVPPCYTVIVHDSHLQDMTLSTHLNATNEISVSVTFGAAITHDFSPPWSCDTRPSSTCNSIVFAVTVYPHGGPFYSSGDNDYLSRVTPVVSVKLFSPLTGKEQPVQGYLSAVSLTFSLTGNTSHGGDAYSSKCLYWNRLTQSWESDGVHLATFDNTTVNNVTCWSGHLTEFAVFRVKQSIAGLITAIALVSLFIALAVTFTCACVLRSKSDTTKLQTSIRL